MNFDGAGLSPADQASGGDSDDRRRAYELFVKLYDRHRPLLEELIEADPDDRPMQLRPISLYVQGIVRGQQAYLISNLPDGKTQSLLQHQMIWTMGRDREAALSIQDQRLSRRHAVIQYLPRRGFFLADLGSTNGSFVNGLLVSGRERLRDGDRIRLGGVAFDFFICHSSHMVGTVPPDLVDHLGHMPLPDETESGMTYRDALAVPLVARLDDEATVMSGNSKHPKAAEIQPDSEHDTDTGLDRSGLVS